MKATRKVATNVSARSDLVKEAKALGLKLSELFERALTDAVGHARRENWLAENREAIESYNAKVAREGVFSDDWRKF